MSDETSQKAAGGLAQGERGHEHHDHAHGDDHTHDDRGHAHDDAHGDHGHDHGDHGHGTGFWAKVKHAVVPHSHDANEAIQTAEEARADGIRTAWIALAWMISIAVAQALIVAISGSIALLADTVHSLGHAVTTIPLVLAFKVGGRAATNRYPYGYRRAEDVVGIFITFVVFLTAVYIIYQSITALITPRPLENLIWVFIAGVVGFLGNEIVAIYRIRGGRRIGSAALIAEGQHARADGFTSLAVVVGVIFAWFGFPQADAIVGLFIGLMILGIMVSSLRSILRRLMDGIDPGLIPQITKAASGVPGVVQVSGARARWSGHRLSVDLDLEVESALSLPQAEEVAARTRQAVKKDVRHVEDVHVQVGSS